MLDAHRLYHPSSSHHVVLYTHLRYGDPKPIVLMFWAVLWRFYDGRIAAAENRA